MLRSGLVSAGEAAGQMPDVTPETFRRLIWTADDGADGRFAGRGECAIMTGETGADARCRRGMAKPRLKIRHLAQGMCQ